MYEIEKGIEIPNKHHLEKYPFRNMQVGDSFWCDAPAKKIHTAVGQYSRRNNVKMCCRKEGEGYRVWRVA